jgi:hypothetical protein
MVAHASQEFFVPSVILGHRFNQRTTCMQLKSKINNRVKVLACKIFPTHDNLVSRTSESSHSM